MAHSIAHLLSLIPKGKVYAKAVHFAKSRPGKQFGPIRLGKELGIPVEHAKLVGSRLARDGHVSYGKFKGQPTFVPKAGGKADDSSDPAGIPGGIGEGQESEQTKPVLRGSKEAPSGGGDVQVDGPAHVEVAEVEAPGKPAELEAKTPEAPSIDRVNLADLMAHPLAAKSMQTLAAAGIKGTPAEIGVRLMLPGRHEELGLSAPEAEDLALHYLSLV